MSITASEIATIISDTLIKQSAPVYKGFIFRSPAVTSIGGNASSQIGTILKEFGSTHVLLVADKGVYQLGLLQQCAQAILQVGIKLTVFAEITGEPDIEIVQQGTALLKSCQADFVLGAGGGSALDTAKAIAVMVDYQGTLEALSSSGLLTNIRSRRVGLGAIPTTAGTGSEVTDIAVITDHVKQIKIPVKGASLVPDLALIDPVLMLNVPASITAATGIDALTHAIEAYVALNSNPISKAYAFHAIEYTAKYLPIVVANGNDLDARYNMAVAAYKAGLAFSNAGLGLTHAIAHQIGSLYHIPHGVANAILLPYVMSFNSLSSESAYAQLAGALGVKRDMMTKRELCHASIKAVYQLICDLELPTNFDNYQIKDGDLAIIAKRAMDDICLQGNPRQTSENKIIKFLEQIISGQALDRILHYS